MYRWCNQHSHANADFLKIPSVSKAYPDTIQNKANAYMGVG